MTGQTNIYDIAIIGGGLAGGLMAITAQQAGFHCCLIDAAPISTKPDTRTTFLSYAAKRLFERLELWADIKDHVLAVEDMLVIDPNNQGGTDSQSFMHFEAAQLGETTAHLGYMVENKYLQQAFAHALSAVTQHQPCKYIAHQQHAAYANVQLAQQGEAFDVQCKLIVAADGRNSSLRKAAQIQTQHRQYEQMAVVCNIAHQESHLNMAQQSFLPNGPLALLPLTDNRSSIIWTEDREIAKELLNLSDEKFIAQLQKTIGAHLGEIKLVSLRGAFPLSMQLAHQFYADRLALIGDAAHAIHPIAGQGYNLTIKDIAALIDILQDQKAAGLDIGHGTALEAYHRWRYFDSASMAFGTDSINRWFKVKDGPLPQMRKRALGFIQKQDGLKRELMKLSGNDVGRLPSLLRA